MVEIKNVKDYKFLLLNSVIFEDNENGKFTGKMMGWKRVMQIVDYERCEESKFNKTRRR